MKIVDKICEIFGLYSEDEELSLPEEETKDDAAVVPMFGAKRWKERDERNARRDKTVFGFGKDKGDDKLISMPLATKQVRVVVIEPVNFDDAQKVADYLRKNQPVVINFEDTDSDVMKRIIDFISGTIYALNGSLKKIGRSILVCAPQNVDIDAENTSYVDRGEYNTMGKIKTIGKVAFIGCGAMGEAILKGILKGGLLTKKDVKVGVPTAARREYLAKQYGVKCFANNEQAVADADFVVLAVKPQMRTTVLTEKLATAIPAKATIVSIMSSVDLDMLHTSIPNRAAVRVMPNTPLAVGAGMSAIAPDGKTTKAALETVKNIFGSCGEIVVLPESSMEAVSAISGCGPGYCFVLIDALADAGVEAGLPRALAIELAAQTFAGSGKMAVETGIHPAQLRDQVTSPGGTTIAGIHAMELHGVRGAMYDAVQAVLKRSEALKGNK